MRGVAVDVVMQMEEEKMEVDADAVVLVAGKSVAEGKNAGIVLYRIWTQKVLEFSQVFLTHVV